MTQLTREMPPEDPFIHVPGAAPPHHIAENELDGDGRPPMARMAGKDDTLNTAGWVGYSDAPGADGAAYRGRDLDDPSTWQQPYSEGRGMFGRLHQLEGDTGE